MNTPNAKPHRMDSIAERVICNEPFRRYREDPRYAAIVKMLASEMIDGWFDATQLSEAIGLAIRHHREYVSVHGQRNMRDEMELELNRRMNIEGVTMKDISDVSDWKP